MALCDAGAFDFAALPYKAILANALALLPYYSVRRHRRVNAAMAQERPINGALVCA